MNVQKKTPRWLAGRTPEQTTNTTTRVYPALAESSSPFAAGVQGMSTPNGELATPHKQLKTVVEGDNDKPDGMVSLQVEALIQNLNPEEQSIPQTTPFSEKIIISCITKDNGPLTKIMSLDPATGQLVKDGSECSMYNGTIKQITIGSASGFAKMLRSMKDNQAIAHGICEHGLARVVTKSMLAHARFEDGPPVIARTKDYIAYPDTPGVILFDHDKARPISVGSDDALASYAPADLVAMLAKVHPEICGAAFVSTPSTSSCISDAEGKVLRGEGTGSHTYMFVTVASDIPRYLKVLGKRLVLAGLGRVEVSRSGSLLERTLVDLMVGSPERLDFIAGAVCRDGLVQQLPPPAVHEGEMLDISTLPDLIEEEEKRYLWMLQKLKNQAKPQQEKVIEEYIDIEADKLAQGGEITIEDARKIIESRQDHILEDADILLFAHLNVGVTVAEVLDDGENYHNKSLADPLEPDYEGGSKTKAKFYWNDGEPIIHSYAHGSKIYQFRQFEREVVKVAETATWSEKDIADFLGRVATDCGVPVEPEAVRQLFNLKLHDKPRFLQLCGEIKQVNGSVKISKLKCEIRRFQRSVSFDPSTSLSSSLSSSYCSSKCSLDHQFLHFEDSLISYKEKDGTPYLVIESIAADKIGEALNGHFAYDNVALCWHSYTGSRWQPCKTTEYDTVVTRLTYIGGGKVGFRNGYVNGIAALLQKSGRNRLPHFSKGKIPFLNGLLDLATKSLQPTTPENAATWVLPYNYEENATCPNFLSWLVKAVDGDADTIVLIRALFNALLTGRPDLQVFIHIIGPGGTGKSTFGKLMSVLVGAENATTTNLRQLETNRFEAANIYGKRLVAIQDADKYGGAVSVLKAMTGQDPLRLERKNQQQDKSFIYEGQTLIMSNERLATTDYTSGIERRRITVEFNNRITKEEKEEFAKCGGEEAILHPEAPGIINWALGISFDEVTSVFKERPERIRKANLEAARYNNHVLDWMLSQLLPDPQAKTQVGSRGQLRGTNSEILYKNSDQWLYPNFLAWCQGSGREEMALQKFSEALIDAAETYGAKISKKKENDGTKISGLRIRGEDEDSWLSLLEK